MKKLLFYFLILSSQLGISQKLENSKIEVNSFSQLQELMNDNSVNFYDVVAAGNDYYNTVDLSVKGTGHKQFMRWINANEYKYFPSGNRSKQDSYFAENQYKSFIKNSNTDKALFNGSWKDLGPYSITNRNEYINGTGTIRNPPVGLGRIEDLYVSPTDTNLLYVSTRSGGFWRSTNHGVTWSGGSTDTLLSSGINTFTVSPTNSQIILINSRNAINGHSNGIYRSVDGGISWTATPFNPTNLSFIGLGENFTISEIAYHPRVPNLVFLATNKGIFRSYDDLNTWIIKLDSGNFSEITFHPTNDSIVYLYGRATTTTISTSNIIYRTIDQGDNYSTSNVIVANRFNADTKLSVSPVCADCVWLASSEGIWISKDKGVSFSLVNSSIYDNWGFKVNDIDSSNILSGSIELFKSTDGGRNYIQVSGGDDDKYIHVDVRNIRVLNGVFYVVTDGFLCKSNDGGTTWKRLSENGLGIRENYKLGVSQSNHYLSITGSQDNGGSIVTDTGWFKISGADGMEGIIHPLNENWMISSSQNGVRRSSKDGGFTMKNATVSEPNMITALPANWEAPLAYDPNNPFVVYDFRFEVWKSENFGESHTLLTIPSTFNGNAISEAEISYNDSKIMAVSCPGEIEISKDGGASFSSIQSGLPGFIISDIAFDPNDDDVIIVTYAHYQADNSKVFITLNGGSTWTNITYNLGSMPIHSVVIDHTNASNIYLGGEIGVYTKPMNGTSWSLYNSGLPNMSVKEMEIMYGSNTLRAATWGRGLWEYSLVGRADYPAIVYTTITNPPTDIQPEVNTDQFVTSKIHYADSLSSVFIEWSADNASFDNLITMTNTVDSTWVSNVPIPQFPAGTRIFFRVIAVGSANDTTETFKYSYEVRPLNNCSASGTNTLSSFYINNVSIENIDNNSNNTFYEKYTSPVLELKIDSTYTLDVSSSVNFSTNNFGAWIDFNADAEFDSSERVLFELNSGNLASNDFTVPSTAKSRQFLTLRVRLSILDEPLPCGDQVGEVEDYLVYINDTTTSLTKLKTENTSINIYPNPNEGNFSVEFNNDDNNQVIRIFNYQGRLIEETNRNGRSKINFNLNLPAGIYFVSLESRKNGVSVVPFIIKK